MTLGVNCCLRGICVIFPTLWFTLASKGERLYCWCARCSLRGKSRVFLVSQYFYLCLLWCLGYGYSQALKASMDFGYALCSHNPRAMFAGCPVLAKCLHSVYNFVWVCPLGTTKICFLCCREFVKPFVFKFRWFAQAFYNLHVVLSLDRCSPVDVWWLNILASLFCYAFWAVCGDWIALNLLLQFWHLCWVKCLCAWVRSTVAWWCGLHGYYCLSQLTVAACDSVVGLLCRLSLMVMWFLF